jgi:hypothetical protein
MLTALVSFAKKTANMRKSILIHTVAAAAGWGLAMAAAIQAAQPASPANQLSSEIKRGDCKAAISLINPDPAANDREAAFITGRLLDEGICVQPDPENAAHFFGRAAQLGDRGGVFDFAGKVGLGVGVEQDYQRAGELCRAAGLDAESHLSNYELGYACTLSGLAGKLLRRTLPTRAFQPAAGAVAQVQFTPASGQIIVRLLPHVAAADMEMGTHISHPVIDAQHEIVKAWHDALLQVPRPDAARLDSQVVELPIDVDMTLEQERKATTEHQQRLLNGDIHNPGLNLK